jgi:hypothetical protein
MLEIILAGTDAKVEAPSRRLLDRDTGKPREHDVLITWDHGHHQIITAIECRDRSRPVGVPDVEAFADKCASTGVNSAVMVSARGFRQTARTKAKRRAITLMDFSEVSQFDWGGTVTFVGYQRQFGMMKCRPMFLGGSPGTILGIYNPSGERISDKEVMQVVMDGVGQAGDLKDEDGVTWRVNFTIVTPGCSAMDVTGKMWPLDHIYVETEFTVVKTVSPATKHEYVGGGARYTIASTDAPVGDRDGKLLMIRRDDGSATASWLPNDPD